MQPFDEDLQAATEGTIVRDCDAFYDIGRRHQMLEVPFADHTRTGEVACELSIRAVSGWAFSSETIICTQIHMEGLVLFDRLRFAST